VATKFFYLFIISVLTNGLLIAQQTSRPFPQHVHYNAGVIQPSNVSQQTMDDAVRAYYNKWEQHYVRENEAPGQYYIWVEGTVGKNECVSEGQGYGMMIVALMAGYDADAQKIYNGLYQYFKAHPSRENPYLMAWAQTGDFTDVDGTSASDGDMDIAYSLLLANVQWGSSGSINYLIEAKSMIAAIKKEEINHETFSVLLSNAVKEDSEDYYDTRTSDFMPAHFKAFEKAAKDNFWNKVIDKNYDLFKFMQDKYSPDAGLVPDFIEHVKSNPDAAKPHYLESKYDGAYNYNACRVPWRIATDFVINGDPRSKSFVAKINKWIRETTQDNPDNISAGYTLEGDDIKNRNYEAFSFIASFAVAAMVDSENQAWLNKLWTYIQGFDIDQFEYYDNTIKLISMIIFSGNYWTP
jgi:endo-1,4-beta-D-glucanase Y